MKTLKTIAAAIVIMFGASILVSVPVAARPVVDLTSSERTQVSSQSTKVVKKKAKKKKNKKVVSKKNTPPIEAVKPEEKLTECFLWFCPQKEGPVSSPVKVASKFDGYTAQKHRQELRTFLSKPFDKDVDPVRIPWCAAFVNAVLHKSGYETTDSLMARSFLSYGQKAKKPEEGDIVVLTRGSSRATGHVGFFLGYDETGQYVRVLGGNQGKMVTIAYYPASRVLGFRKPTAA